MPSQLEFTHSDLQMFTPSGRFQPDKKICFSMSDFHPGTVRSVYPIQPLTAPNLTTDFPLPSGTQHGA